MILYVGFIGLLLLVANATSFSVRLRNGAVFLISFFFVGFRYEVGFDWPFYKGMFEVFATVDLATFVENTAFYQEIYPAEIGFLLLTYGASQLLGAYEFYQALITLFFLASLYQLGTALGVRNLGFALVAIHLFILFSLEFSTVRQALAIALFNFGLVGLLQGNRLRVVVLFSLAVTVQITSVIYIFAILFAFGAPRNVWITFVIALFLLVPLSSPTLILSNLDILPSFASAKLKYYLTERSYGGSLLEISHALSFYFIASWSALRGLRRSADSREAQVLLKFALILAITAILFFYFNTLRNRILYELVIVLSLGAFSPIVRGIRHMRGVLFGFGLVLFLKFLVQSSNYMYIPYQNYLVFQITDTQSTGSERIDRLQKLLQGR